MVKFEEQVDSLLVSQWKHAYINYKQFKQHLKKIREAFDKERRQAREKGPHHDDHNASQEHIHQSLSASPELDSRQIDHDDWLPSSQSSTKMLKQQIMHRGKSDAQSVGGDTQLTGPQCQAEMQRFFKNLDAQFNIVNTFYRCKEHEYASWINQLQAQLENLVDETKLPQATADNAWTEAKRTKENQVDCIDIPKLNKPPKALRFSLIELYRSLVLLKDYCFLNMAVLGRILKKYDKITGQNASDVYLAAVESSYFSTSDKVKKMMEKVESMFTEHFTNHRHHEALAYLRPAKTKNSQQLTFFLGLFSGSSMILFFIFLLLISMQHPWKLSVKNLSETQFDFYTSSTLALILLHLYVYGLDVLLWQRFHINHRVIFDLPKLGYGDVLLLSTGFTTIVLGGIVMQFVLRNTSAVLSLTVTLALCCFLLLLPVDICCKSMRLTFLRHIWHILCSPLYKVSFSDFFLADQLTSQITVFRNLAWILCYYFCSRFDPHRLMTCKGGIPFQEFAYFMSALPYWWRLMQCFRLWMDEGDRAQIANFGKYLSATVAIVVRLTLQNTDSTEWLILFVISSALAASYQLYWDTIMDWGLLQPNSVNPWLRDKLIVRHKYMYFVLMGINTILRLDWIFFALYSRESWINHSTMELFFASMEVFRRGLWNFFRLENEHLKRLARCRAFKTITSSTVPVNMGFEQYI